MIYFSALYLFVAVVKLFSGNEDGVLYLLLLAIVMALWAIYNRIGKKR